MTYDFVNQLNCHKLKVMYRLHIPSTRAGRGIGFRYLTVISPSERVRNCEARALFQSLDAGRTMRRVCTRPYELSFDSSISIKL